MNNTSKEQTLQVCGRCGRCKRILPAEDFYFNKRTGIPDNYCKECRRLASQKHRKKKKQILADRKKKADTPIITNTKDPALQRKLIRKAFLTIADRIKRKKEKSSK